MPPFETTPCGRMAEMEAKMTWNALLNGRRLIRGKRTDPVRRRANAIQALLMRAGLSDPLWLAAGGPYEKNCPPRTRTTGAGASD